MSKEQSTPRGASLTARATGEHDAVEYENGWYVQKPDYDKPLDFACYITVKGPFKQQATAERWADRLNRTGSVSASEAKRTKMVSA